ncbi:formate/nitrite transporter family protein [Novosphingobium guangzhouense]|uniref:Transporter (Formate/nitrite transporter family protein) n=1 Tax=Novosphingobium guangzhouense TaxID=1850347 RepID=A0A2K2G3F7_9SPHN|nr:formate/nitrite transporter family protein [Novosphingobium guangzhouense]PNU05585.1 transporter (formate/nitrite transporter family protein) [Novosphingobium guangzhouense]
MTETPTSARDPAVDEEPDEALDAAEVQDVEDRRAGSSKIVHEVVRLQGEEELKRPALALSLSGIAAGLAIALSLLCELFLRSHLPDTDWAPLIYFLGYPIGYVIVVMGRLQLFTESTVTAVLPVAASPSLDKFGRLARLWGCVLVGNLVGVTLVSALMAGEIIITHEQRMIALDILGKLELQHWTRTLTLGIPAGFIMAAIAWVLPNARGSEFWVIFALTYVIALGGFAHVVTGSSQASFLWLSGNISFAEAWVEFTLPALIGNIIGGTGLFAVLAHGQMRSDLSADQPHSDHRSRAG